MAALHRIQWIDSEIRAERFPNARRVAERFEVSSRQAQRDFEYLRDSLGAPLVYEPLRRGYRYDGEPFVLPGPFVTAEQRDVLGSLAGYYARWASRHRDPSAEDMATLFTRLAGREAAYRRLTDAAGSDAAQTAPGLRAVPGTGPMGGALPFLAVLSLPRALPLPGMRGLGVPVAESLAPYYRGDGGPARITCEFHDPDAFLSALMTAGQPLRVEHPRWLRERLASRLDELRAANATGTTF